MVVFKRKLHGRIYSYHSGLDLGALSQADFSWWEQDLTSGLREQVQPRDFFTLGVAWGGVEVEVELVEVVEVLSG
jgi:hypothetical protein